MTAICNSAATNIKKERVSLHLYIIHLSPYNKGIDPLKEMPSVNSKKRDWPIKKTDGSYKDDTEYKKHYE